MAVVRDAEVGAGETGGATQVAQGVVGVSVAAAHRSHHRLARCRTLARCDPELGDHAVLALRTDHAAARVYSCNTTIHIS